MRPPSSLAPGPSFAVVTHRVARGTSDRGEISTRTTVLPFGHLTGGTPCEWVSQRLRELIPQLGKLASDPEYFTHFRTGAKSERLLSLSREI